MVRIVEKRLGRVGKRRRKLQSRPMTSAQGKRVHGVRVDAQSHSFGEDLLASFARSVERARRENKQLFGHRDRVDDDEE
jgi:hypothetical protein